MRDDPLHGFLPGARQEAKISMKPPGTVCELQQEVVILIVAVVIVLALLLVGVMREVIGAVLLIVFLGGTALSVRS